MRILDWLVTDLEAHQYYRNAYDSVFHRSAMGRAVNLGKNADAKEHYLLLKNTGYLTLDDRIVYTSAVCPVCSFLLRAIRKTASVLRRRK